MFSCRGSDVRSLSDSALIPSVALMAGTDPSLVGNSTAMLEDCGARRCRRRRGILGGKEPSAKEYQGNCFSLAPLLVDCSQ